MGKAGVPPAVVCESPLMQARRLLYPLFRSQVPTMNYLLYRTDCGVILRF